MQIEKCPFCGEEPDLIFSINVLSQYGVGTFHVECTTCENIFTDRYNHRQDVIDSWNRCKVKEETECNEK